jgi:hypothetical protein
MYICMLIPNLEAELKSVVYFRNYWQKKVPLTAKPRSLVHYTLNFEWEKPEFAPVVK